MQYINRGPSLDEQTGDSIGRGLSQGLQILANQKLQQAQNNHVYNYLKTSNPNMSDQEARAIASMGPQYHEMAIKAAQQAQGNAAMGQYLNAMAGNQQQAPSISQTPSSSGIQNIQAMGDPSQQQQFAPGSFQARASNLQEPQPSMQAAAQKNATMAAGAGVSPIGQQNVPTQPIDFSHVPVQQQIQLAGLGMKSKAEQRKAAEFERKLEQGERNLDLKRELGGRRATTQEKRQEEMQRYHDETVGIKKGQLGLGEKKFTEKQAVDRWKYNQKYITGANNRARAALENKWRWSTMRELYRSPDKITPTAYTMLQHLGMDTGDWIGKEGELLVKLSSDFKKNISLLSSANGGVVPVSEFKALEQAIPTILNSPEGGISITRLVENAEKLDEATAKEIKSLTEKNGKVPPFDLQEQVNEKVSKLADTIRKQAVDIVKGFKQPGDMVSDLSELAINPVGTFAKGPKGEIVIVDINPKTNKKYARKATPQEEQEAKALEAALGE